MERGERDREHMDVCREEEKKANVINLKNKMGPCFKKDH